MPTLQITPDALDLLQNVADTLAKSRKMVIITGAGISTNSGIPVCHTFILAVFITYTC
jgi:NAD-dependent histone deacetylase SIR2